MNEWYREGAVSGGWLMMTLAMVLFWGLVIVAVVYVFRDADHRSSSAPMQPGPRDPRTILDERFARGELEADEYHARLETLGKGDRVYVR